MRVTGTGITQFDVNVYKWQSNTEYSFSFLEVSNGDFKPIDRGASEDVYESTIELKGLLSDTGTYKGIQQFLSEIKANRTIDSNVITLSEINDGEHFFGEDVNYASGVSCTVLKISEISQPQFNTYSLKVTLRLLSPTFVGTSTFPDLAILSPDFKTEDKWSINKQDSYTGTFTYVEKDTDQGFFEGTFLFTRLEMRRLRRFVATNRGASFSLSGIDGVTYPFGEAWGSGAWDVRILEFKDLGFWGANNYKASLKLTTIG